MSTYFFFYLASKWMETNYIKKYFFCIDFFFIDIWIATHRLWRYKVRRAELRMNYCTKLFLFEVIWWILTHTLYTRWKKDWAQVENYFFFFELTLFLTQQQQNILLATLIWNRMTWKTGLFWKRITPESCFYLFFILLSTTEDLSQYEWITVGRHIIYLFILFL